MGRLARAVPAVPVNERRRTGGSGSAGRDCIAITPAGLLFRKRCGLRISAEPRLSFEKVKKKRFPLRWKTLYGAARLCLRQRILFI